MPYMTNEEKNKYDAKYRKLSEPGGPWHNVFELLRIIDLPAGKAKHPFTIGPKHVEHAADRCGGMFGEETCRKIPCEWKDRDGTRCPHDFDEHKTDFALLVKLVRNLTNKEAHAALLAVKVDMEADGLSGIGFDNLFQEGRPNAGYGETVKTWYTIAPPENSKA